MDTLPPAEVARRWFEVMWNERKPGLIPELMATDAVGHAEGGQDFIGPEGFSVFQQEFLRAIPDIHIEVVRILSDAEEACVHWRACGNHQGAAFGLEPTGSALSFQGVTWVRVKDGKIIEGWDFWNLGGLMQTMSAP